MKKFILISFLLLSFFGIINAQSTQLKEAFDQVNTTLKEYKFVSQDVDGSGETGRTKSIQIMLGNGTFGIIILDDFGEFADPFFGFKHGYKLIAVPINNVEFYPSYSELQIKTNNDEDVLFIYDNQKELLDKYSICGTEGNIKKLKRELDNLISLAIEENFNGQIGVPTQSQPAKKNPKSKTKRKK